MQGAQVLSLVWELRSHIPSSVTRKKRKKRSISSKSWVFIRGLWSTGKQGVASIQEVMCETCNQKKKTVLPRMQAGKRYYKHRGCIYNNNTKTRQTCKKLSESWGRRVQSCSRGRQTRRSLSALVKDSGVLWEQGSIFKQQNDTVGTAFWKGSFQLQLIRSRVRVKFDFEARLSFFSLSVSSFSRQSQHVSPALSICV